MTIERNTLRKLAGIFADNPAQSEAGDLSAEKIIEMADNRLYTVKQTGRNKIIPTRSRPAD